jgi:hypothetical protein
MWHANKARIPSSAVMRTRLLFVGGGGVPSSVALTAVEVVDGAMVDEDALECTL